MLFIHFSKKGVYMYFSSTYLFKWMWCELYILDQQVVGGGGGTDRWPVRADELQRHESFPQLRCQEIMLVVTSNVWDAAFCLPYINVKSTKHTPCESKKERLSDEWVNKLYRGAEMLTKLVARGLLPNASLYVKIISLLSEECCSYDKYFHSSSIQCCLHSFGTRLNKRHLRRYLS